MYPEHLLACDIVREVVMHLNHFFKGTYGNFYSMLPAASGYMVTEKVLFSVSLDPSVQNTFSIQHTAPHEVMILMNVVGRIIC